MANLVTPSQHTDTLPSDEQIVEDELSNEVVKIEDAARAMGIHADEDGPRELNMEEDLDVNEKTQ